MTTILKLFQLAEHTANQSSDRSVACLMREHGRCGGVTHPEYIGGFGPCECECHNYGAGSL